MRVLHLIERALTKSSGIVSVGIALAAVTMLLVQLAPAATVNYTAGDVAPMQFPGPYPPPAGASHLLDGEGYPGDEVGLTSYSDSLPLVPGTYTQQINTLDWSVSYTYNGTDGDLGNDSPSGGDWPDLNFPFTLTRTLSFAGGSTGSISQTGLLRTTWDDDYLSLNAGSTSTFFVPGYQIDVTPLAVAEANVQSAPGFPSGTPWSQAPRAVTAEFVVTAVPEPATIALVGLGLVGGVLFLRRKRR